MLIIFFPAVARGGGFSAWSPAVNLEDESGQAALYFSSNQTGNSDIYSSVVQSDGTFRAAEAVAGLNTSFEDARPDLSRDGLEIVFDSNRPGTGDQSGLRQCQVHFDRASARRVRSTAPGAAHSEGHDFEA